MVLGKAAAGERLARRKAASAHPRNRGGKPGLMLELLQTGTRYTNRCSQLRPTIPSNAPRRPPGKTMKPKWRVLGTPPTR